MYITCNNCCIAAKFGTSVAHDKPIPHAKQNFEISTDVTNNDVIMSKFKCFHRKALNSIRLYHNSLWIKLFKIWSGYKLIIADFIPEVRIEKNIF